MIRTITLVSFFLLAVFTVTQAQTVMYSQNFEDSTRLFQNYVRMNYDKGDPAGTDWDTLKTVPWVIGHAGNSGNHAAIATSDYDPATPADDWFITPAIRIGESSELSWKSLSLLSGRTDSYRVYVSTTEQSVAGCQFNGPAASFSSSNANAFETKTLNLAAAGYSNTTVYIGFQLNTASGGGRLAIDDLKVTENTTPFVSLKFNVDMSRYITDSLFNPRTDTVDIAGNFNKFDGTQNILSIVPGTDSTVYTTTIAGFLNGDRLEFKFRINSSWSDTSVEFPYGQPNRVWVVEPGKYTFSCYYNDHGTTFGIPENSLMDQVSVYPNPATGPVALKIPSAIDRVRLVSLTGSLLQDLQIDSSHQPLINVQPMPSGTYLLLFYSGQQYCGYRKLIRK
jgi:hypothetical protein